MAEATKKPTATKKPQGRKPKQQATAETETSGVALTFSLQGVDWEIDPARLEDFEVIAWIADIDNGSDEAAFSAASLLKRLLGDSQFSHAMKVLRDPSTGRVPPEKGVEFLLEILAATAPNS